MPEHELAGPMRSQPPENYQRYFVPAIGRPLADDLLAIAALRAGERVVDVGCGTGVVARLARDAVGPKGAVAGIDVNAGMLTVARSVTPADAHIDWKEGNAESLPLADDSFDVALCQMTLQFVEDQQKAVREMFRVLVRGGRVVLNLPGPTAPQFEALADSMGRHVIPQGKDFVERVFSLHDPNEVQRLLRSAGFSRIEVRTGTRDLSLPAPREFLWQYVGSTPLAEPVKGADHASRTAFETEVLNAWKPFAQDGGMLLHQPMLVARAYK